jgi:uncharacterized protein (DUF169 family)
MNCREMAHCREIAARLQQALQLVWPPVAVCFEDRPPQDVPRVAAAGPSGCSYWKRAAEGESFYTLAADHYHCPIGAHTHNIELPEEHSSERSGLLQTMYELGYLRPDEVADIPRRRAPFNVAVYAPLATAARRPDVVLFRGNCRQMMILAEAAQGAGVRSAAAMMGRPTCAAIGHVLHSGQAVVSLGCIGNRVYTQLADDELYVVLPGEGLEAVAAVLDRLVEANRQLEDYHRARIAAVSR